MNILITGGSGFLGRHLARKLLDDGAERVCLYSRGEHTQADARQTLQNDPRLRCFIGDVRDYRRLTTALQGVSCVVHAAALKRIEVGEYNPTELVRTNVEGTINVLEASQHCERMVLVSTDKAVNPVNAYGASKLIAEKLFLAAGRTVVRYGNVTGSTGSVIEKWRNDPGHATMTDPECTRFWMPIGQAVAMVADTIKLGEGGIHVPILPAYRLGDLAVAMGVSPKVTGLGCHEKRHETLDGVTDSSMARRMTIDELRRELR